MFVQSQFAHLFITNFCLIFFKKKKKFFTHSADYVQKVFKAFKTVRDKRLIGAEMGSLKKKKKEKKGGKKEKLRDIFKE